jgi:hypothetical protein
MVKTTAPGVELFDLDAYGRLSFAVGWSDEFPEDEECELLEIAKTLDMDDDEFEDWSEDEYFKSGEADRGDWLACADIDRRGDWVGYHVMVNSDAGGVCEDVQSGVLSVDEARNRLPGLLESYYDMGGEFLSGSGWWYTRSEAKECRKAIERWKRRVEEITK